MAHAKMNYASKVVNGDVEILYNSEYVGDAITLDEDAFDNGVVKAGTPMAKNGKKAELLGDTKGVWTLQITTAFAEDEALTINGVEYTCGTEEDVATKVFAGADAASQVTSLLKMVKASGFVVAAVQGATDKIGFTQVAANEDGDAPTASTEATTGAIGEVTRVTAPVDGHSNAYGILLVDVYEERPQGTVVIGGYINEKVAAAHAGVTYGKAVNDALKNVVFINFD